MSLLKNLDELDFRANHITTNLNTKGNENWTYDVVEDESISYQVN